MKNPLHPPPDRTLLPAGQIDKTYRRMRLKVFIGAFVGYAAYYLVRKNLSLAAPGLIEEGLLDKAGIGIAGSAVSIAYAFSKFIMGSISDRSDARRFLVAGLAMASLLMIGVGLLPLGAANLGANAAVMFGCMLLVGWISGMGWPPCGRVMAHWFSQNERSFKMSLWNTSHTVGSGSLGLLAIAGVTILASTGMSQTWRAAFIFPSAIALLLAAFCWWALRDRPEACGLPSVENWRDDHSGKKNAEGEQARIPLRRLFVDYVFKNRMLWMIAVANAFVYLVRYGIGDWAPVYLREMNIMTGEQSSLAFSLHNYAGVPGTIVCGWISARYFRGRCAPANVTYMLLVLVGILLYWQAMPLAGWWAGTFGGDPAAVCRTIVYASLCEIGFCIYGPVALIGVQALNLVPKNAAGTAAGFVGLFGYLIGDALLAKIVMGGVAQSSGWDAAFRMFVVAGIAGALLCAATWRKEKAQTNVNILSQDR